MVYLIVGIFILVIIFLIGIFIVYVGIKSWNYKVIL